MTVEEMRMKKKELGYTNEKISELSGVPVGTVQKIFAGVTSTPRYDTLMALEYIFDERNNHVSESVTPYQVRKQGEYTLEDYYALPDERRIELIDGVIYDMSSPIFGKKEETASPLLLPQMYSLTVTIRRWCSRMYL